MYVKRSGRIVAEAQLDGERRFFYSDEKGDTFKDEKTARAFLRRLREQGLAAKQKAAAQTFGDFLDEWLDVVIAAQRKPGTHASYDRRIRRHVPEALRRVPLATLTPAMLQRWVNGLSETLSAPFIRAVASTVHVALRQAVRWERLPRDPMQHVQLPDGPAPEPAVWSPEDAKRFLEACPRAPLGAAFATALYLGLRRGEVLGLGWDDLDLDGRTATIRHNLQAVGGELRLGSPKTARSARTLHMPAALVAILRRHRAAQLEGRLLWGEDWQDQGLVFPNTRGGPMQPTALGNAFRRFLAEEDLPPLSLHGLRHTCGTALLLAGEDMRVVMEILGHTDLKMTQRYVHVLERQKKGAADSLDRFLGG